ncbi:ABC transporter ATP-binding protein [Sciscionella marina]|uniref:ABC transporter ATP-binding protein n=1 Tax=Sciscionella marina TaxID=508770 RepID=UPI0003813007|nr:ATP-binding cassette domain-containing protein [Sciscionella marina]
MTGRAVEIDHISKSFGPTDIWRDVTMTLPAGEVSVLLGPSGTGKSVLLKALIGLLKPESGRITVAGTDLVHCSEHELYRARRLFGVMFQDGALFGSMNLYDNIAFPLREHTRKSEHEIRNNVLERLAMVGLSGAEDRLPGEVSGGMRKRASLARALVLDPEIILCDEPDSGLDPVRTAYLSQLLIDINTQIDATILVVTHNINIARTVPDNLGMLFRKRLVMFGPREVLLTSHEHVVRQFLHGDRSGPIGMSEEKDTEAETESLTSSGDTAGDDEVRDQIPAQLEPSPGLPRRAAKRRHLRTVAREFGSLPAAARQALSHIMSEEDRRQLEMEAVD